MNVCCLCVTVWLSQAPRHPEGLAGRLLGWLGSVLNVVRKVPQPEEASRNGAAYSAASAVGGQPQPQSPQPPQPPQPGGQLELNATFPSSALAQRSPGSTPPGPQLDALNDLELLVLLRPNMERRIIVTSEPVRRGPCMSCSQSEDASG
ncbi:unnamed protein product [Symbiodinium sp. CCMP2592]|nr:unnamed protein product [Symbiodinium sp. CCMP2592]